MLKSELVDRLEDIEWEDFEVKEARSDVPVSAWETVSAFSNTAGGWLVFGVRKQGTTYEITGVSNPAKIEQDFTTVLRNGTKFNKVIDVKSKKYNFDGISVLAFYIPRKSAKEKPIYFNTQRNTFIRTGSGDQRATPEEIDSFFRLASFEDKDKEPTDFGIGDLDQTTIERYRTYFSNVNPGHRYNALSDSELLHKLGALVDGKATYGGILIFGTEELLVRTFPNYRIDYIEIPGTSYTDAPTRYSFRLSSEVNLFQTFFDVYERLVKKVDIPFSVKNGIRDDDPPHLQAVREALVNLMIHSDYFSKANPRIRIFTDRFEFFNPGPLPKPIESILKEDFSLPRNPVVARMFRTIRLAETMGSGFHKMLAGWERHNGTKPVVEGDFDYYKITFPLPSSASDRTTGKTTDKRSVEPTSSVAEDTIKDTTKDTISKLSDNERHIYESMCENPKVTAEELSESLGINLRNTKKNIEKLKEKELVARKGSKKAGYWEVLE